MSTPRLAPLVCAVLFAACGAAGDPAPVEATAPARRPERRPAPAPVAKAEPAPEPAIDPQRPGSFAEEEARLARELAAAERRAGRAREPAALAEAAELRLARARLTGDDDDLVAAEKLVARAFKAAGAGAGPWSTRAALEVSLGRLDRAAAALDAMEGGQLAPAEARALAAARADLAFRQGRYEAARAGFEAALGPEETPTELSRLAMYRWRTGDFEGAGRLVRGALRLLHGEPGEAAASLHLLRGEIELERGRVDEALVCFRDAEVALRGWWRVDAAIAGALARQGETDEALALAEDVTRRTQDPAVIDAMAAIHGASGRTEAAKGLYARARERHEARLARAPGAARAAAIEHYLASGEDPGRAVALAEAERDAGPTVEAQVALARAYLAAGRVPEARVAVEAALAGPWHAVALHTAAAEVFAAAGDASRATIERARAAAIDPGRAR